MAFCHAAMFSRPPAGTVATAVVFGRAARNSSANMGWVPSVVQSELNSDADDHETEAAEADTPPQPDTAADGHRDQAQARELDRDVQPGPRAKRHGGQY